MISKRVAMQWVTTRFPRSLCLTAAAGGDERTDTKENVEEAKEREGSLFDDGGGVREDYATRETDGVDGGGNHAEEG
jgi:hypothetical protein